MPDTEKTEHEKPDGGLKEIFTSLMIAFAMALSFRGFVVEGFVIPTGSMAPTLLGMHMRFQAPETGEDWSVGPWHYGDTPSGKVPKKIQGQSLHGPVSVGVPGTGSALSGGASEIRMSQSDVPRRGGDRIFVLKYLYQVFNPDRFDVVVFKNPENPYENYIKRLIGLPGEQIALVDGDVFTRPAEVGGSGNPWEGEGWRIGRKSERVQRDLWYTVFDSRYTPIGPGTSFVAPWQGDGWSYPGDGKYRNESSTSLLTWDSENWPITDFVHYNETGRPTGRPGGHNISAAEGSMASRTPGTTTFVMPCSDVRTLVSVSPDGDGLQVTLTLRTRGNLFRARLTPDEAVLEMRADQNGAAWREIDRNAVSALVRPSRIATVEFWHVDQALYLFVDGRRVAGGSKDGAYEWGPGERIAFTTGLGMNYIEQNQSVLFDASNYTTPELAWSFDGSPVTIHRAGIWRDLYTQPVPYARLRTGEMTRGTHPSSVVTLKSNQFFVCGDNSASSLDSRLMETIDPWVDHEFNPGSPGIVPRELLIGKAFFVYFPSLQWRGKIPVPDFGRMRFIR